MSTNSNTNLHTGDFPNQYITGNIAYTSSAISGTTYSITPNTAYVTVTTDCNFSNVLSTNADDIQFSDGTRIKDTLNKINERLSILKPDPAKLEKYEALRKAYDHYLFLEKLLHEEENKK